MVFFLNYVFQGAGLDIGTTVTKSQDDSLKSNSRSDKVDDVKMEKVAHFGTIINIIDALQDEEIGTSWRYG